MTSAKNVVLTAIKFKGIEQARQEAATLADGLLCSKAYVLNIIRKVEKGNIQIR